MAFPYYDDTLDYSKYIEMRGRVVGAFRLKYDENPNSITPQSCGVLEIDRNGIYLGVHIFDSREEAERKRETFPAIRRDVPIFSALELSRGRIVDSEKNNGYFF